MHVRGLQAATLLCAKALPGPARTHTAPVTSSKAAAPTRRTNRSLSLCRRAFSALRRSSSSCRRGSTSVSYASFMSVCRPAENAHDLTDLT